MKGPAARLLLGVDLAATFAFGLDGGGAAVNADLDAFGVLVLAFTTALGGGVVRDVLIGALPPAAIRDWRYAGAAFAGGACALLAGQVVEQIPVEALVVVGAAGLGLFGMAGASKGLDYGLQPFIAVLMGTITAVGGGVLRDVMLNVVPTVLRAEILAGAALVGCSVMVIGARLGVPRPMAMLIGGSVCFAVRVLAVWQGWNLARA